MITESVIKEIFHTSWEITEPWKNHFHVVLPRNNIDPESRGYFSPKGDTVEFFTSDPSLRDDVMESFDELDYDTKRFEKEGNFYLSIFRKRKEFVTGFTGTCDFCKLALVGDINNCSHCGATQGI